MADYAALEGGGVAEESGGDRLAVRLFLVQYVMIMGGNNTSASSQPPTTPQP